MKIETKKILTIEIEGEDINLLKSGLKKVVQDIDRIGLKHTGMSIEEGDIIKRLKDQLHE